MKAIIVYFSYMGNTKKIAEMIHDKIGGDIVRVETIVPYGEDYNQVVNQGEDEVNHGFMPEIKPLDISIENYDIVILGTPVWWYTFAPAIKTFITNNDLSRKKIYPFVTNGGWIGHTFKDIKNACVDSVVEKGINIRFDATHLCTPISEIEKWIDRIK